jgi:glycosyltransferase involved in cell wall biosynthesis
MSARGQISISATNPCHLFDLAKSLHARQRLGRYYSGYPRWKLSPPSEFPLVARSSRTLATYGLLQLPAVLQPAPHRLFRWQDRGFDAAVSRALDGERAQTLHAMPGQALATFTAAQAKGIRTVLNHASGPVRQQLALVAEEYRRAGLAPASHHGFDADYFKREDAEYALADRHCVASAIVREQLISAGVAADRIWVVPYAADAARFFPPADGGHRDRLRVIFAGQLVLRKGLRIAFDALAQVRQSQPATLELYGAVSREMRSTLAALADRPWLKLHAAVDHATLAEVFRRAGMLVLPSWEEAFGLVVPQALACGLPCLVSDRVGASDLIVHRRNGSIFPAGDPAALAAEIRWWSENPAAFQTSPLTWADCARQLLELTETLRSA